MELLKKRKLSLAQQKVYHYILERINDGALAVGDRVPPEVELARRIGVNRMNVQVTLQYLESHGVLTRNKRGGTVVVMKPSPFMVGDLKRNVAKFVTVLNPLDRIGERIHWNQEIRTVLENNLREKGLALNIVNIPVVNDPAAMGKKLCELAQTGPAALLCISSGELNNLMKNHPEIFFKYHRHVIVFGRDVIDWSFFPYNTVSVDLFNEGVIAAEYAFANGYEQVFFGIRKYIEACIWIRPRKEGLRCGLQRLSNDELTARDIVLENDLEQVIEAINAGKKVLIAAANDDAAARFIDALTELTDKVPGRDYGTISFDNDVAYKEYQLTTIAPPLDKIGEALAELITEVTGKTGDRTSFIKIKSQLIKRKTA